MPTGRREMMRASARVVVGFSGAVAWLLVLGFMLFAAAVMRQPHEEEVHGGPPLASQAGPQASPRPDGPPATPPTGPSPANPSIANPAPARADGIVVLTGTDQRIVEGARLLREGRAARMLVSGVNRRTSREDVHRISGLDDARFACCVDLGYEARDTAGNAEEARRWAQARGFRSLLVVTSNYHMPRSLLVFRIAMPGASFVPHPVPTKVMRPTPWWLHVTTTRVLLAEYLKFLPTAARLVATRLFYGADSIRADMLPMDAPVLPDPGVRSGSAPDGAPRPARREAHGAPSALMSPLPEVNK